ncbi:amidase signature domain-containing protein [Chaetomium sp. MPI-SDFR-AT-0129]|nr:amidase signature domain-containing protein [Chaetomium sp. MPI-SDFR-AT-0129]
MATITTPDIVRLTASELQHLLSSEKLTSVDLVKASLAQIDRHNRKGLTLRAVISVAPDDIVLERAAMLDAERARDRVRGPFHGIPVLLKDVAKTHSDLRMPTTLGSFAFLGAKANDSADIVDELMEKGLIIIGKTNLNELSSWKAMGSTNGWSAVGGQTTSAYVEGGVKREDGVMGHNNPCGASTGSAVGVSAGFAPIALGTEVDGSLVQPSARAGLYALKPTIGSTNLRGIFAVSEDFDALGGMAKSVLDLAHLTELVLIREDREKLPADGYLSFLKKDFGGLRVGFVDPELWRWPENIQRQHGNSLEQLRAGYTTAMERLENHGATVTYPISLPAASEFMLSGQPAKITAIRHVFRENVEGYLNSLSSSEVRTLPELVQFNRENSDKELPPDFPDQNRLIDTLENVIDRQTYEAAINLCRTVGRDQGVDKALNEHDLDLVALPMDSPAPRIAAAAGYPIATVPLGTLDHNGRPFGLAIIAKGGREDLLFAFMSAFEAVSPPRPVPLQLTA